MAATPTASSTWCYVFCAITNGSHRKRVHIIAPNIRELVVGLNPLAPLPDTDPAVIAGAMQQAFARVWGDEDTHKTPLTRRILRNIFTALAESGRPLADAAQLLDYDDPHRFAARAYRRTSRMRMRGKSSSASNGCQKSHAAFRTSRQTSSAPRTGSRSFLRAKPFG